MIACPGRRATPASHLAIITTLHSLGPWEPPLPLVCLLEIPASGVHPVPPPHPLLRRPHSPQHADSSLSSFPLIRSGACRTAAARSWTR